MFLDESLSVVDVKAKDSDGRFYQIEIQLELKKFTAERIETEEQRWLKFFKDGEQLDETALPDWMNTDEEASHENPETVFR